MIRMTLHIEDTVGAQVQVLDDGTTISEILYALGWVKKEKARQASKYQRNIKPRLEALKQARPKPEPPAPEPEVPKRPRGRPRKTPAQ
jgi:hypothetical protein